MTNKAISGVKRTTHTQLKRDIDWPNMKMKPLEPITFLFCFCSFSSNENTTIKFKIARITFALMHTHRLTRDYKIAEQQNEQ